MTLRPESSQARTTTVPMRNAPDALVVAPGSTVPGRARAAAPLRREGPAKLTGEALYADDLVFPGAWYGATIRSTVRMVASVTSRRTRSFAWDQVVIITAADIPGENIVASIKADQPVLVPIGGEIQHHAEPLVLVAAPDRETLRAARAALRPVVDKLPPVLDPLDSNHVFAHYDIANGDVAAGFKAADRIIEGEYRVGHQEQLYIENNAMIAVPRDDGGITVTGSLQCPYYVHAAMRKALALTDAQAVVVQAETGGGFGGKEEYPSIIALPRRAPGAQDRPAGQDDLRPARGHRGHDQAPPGGRIRHRTGVTRDGTLVAQDIEVVMDGGAYCTLTPVVLSRGALHAAGPVPLPERARSDARATRTNTPPNGAFRGFGAPQIEFAVETHLNRIAEALDLSPLEIRRRNVYAIGDETAHRPDPERERGRRGGPRARGRGRGFERIARANARARAERDGIGNGAERVAWSPARRGRPPGSVLRSAGTEPGSPVRAR